MDKQIYEFEFPREVKDAILALDDEVRLKIIEYLMINEKLYYSKILDQLNLSIEKKWVDQHLSTLSKFGLISRYTTSLQVDMDSKSYYKLTSFAVKFLNGLLLSLEPMETFIQILQKEGHSSEEERDPDDYITFSVKMLKSGRNTMSDSDLSWKVDPTSIQTPPKSKIPLNKKIARFETIIT